MSGCVRSEILKQLRDQPLHILMTFASVWAIANGLMWLGAPHLPAVIVGSVGTLLWAGWREYRQWPSSRWWDPPLDWAFEALGLGLGVWWVGGPALW